MIAGIKAVSSAIGRGQASIELGTSCSLHAGGQRAEQVLSARIVHHSLAVAAVSEAGRYYRRVGSVRQ